MSLPSHVISFIDKYLPYAIASNKTSGINIVFTLAQDGIESGYGSKAIGNNISGVKAQLSDTNKKLALTREVLPKSKRAYYTDYFTSNGRRISSIKSYASDKDEWMVYDWFKDYATVTDAFNDKAKVIHRITKLTPAEIRKLSAYEIAKKTADGGYATGTSYLTLLNSVIKSIDEYIKERLKTALTSPVNTQKNTGLMIGGGLLLVVLLLPSSSNAKSESGLSGFSSTELLIGGLMIAATVTTVILSKNLFSMENSADKISKHVLKNDVYKSATATAKGIDNTPTASAWENAKLLAENVLDKIIDHFGPIVFTSFYRGPALNKAVGGSATSQHMYAQAADISAPKGATYTNADIYRFIQNNLPYDQIIWEFGSDKNPDWVHVSFSKVRNKKQGLKAIKTGAGTKYIGYNA